MTLAINTPRESDAATVRAEIKIDLVSPNSSRPTMDCAAPQTLSQPRTSSDMPARVGTKLGRQLHIVKIYPTSATTIAASVTVISVENRSTAHAA